MLPKAERGEEAFERYGQAVAFVESFSNTSVQKKTPASDPAIFVNRTKFMLDLLGNPEKRLSFVHVAGTAGKGTAAAMIHSALVRSGKRAGLFTSPYASAAIEEIQTNGTYIAPDEFADIVDLLKPAVEKTRLSKFGAPIASELFFILSLVYFARQKCEWAVIEAGIGGRYDATNAIPAPEISLITCVDYDHTKILGKTLREIATDKAGIIKRGSAFFTTEARKPLLDLFARICKKEGAEFHAVGGSGAELASAVALRLGLKAPVEPVKLPCRFEIVSREPIIVLDGAHDRIKMRDTAAKLRELSYKKLFLVIGAAGTGPDIRRMFPEIVPLADRVIITSLRAGKRSLAHPDALLPFIRASRKTGAAVDTVADPREALAKARAEAGTGDCILVTGAFFLSGELRKDFVPEPFVLRERKSFR